MTIKNYLTPAVVAIALLATLPAQAQKKADIIVKVNAPVADIQPTMWGVFFEDINLGADGGIYAELVKNRSFEFFRPMMGWSTTPRQVKEGTLLVVNRQDKNT